MMSDTKIDELALKSRSLSWHIDRSRYCNIAVVINITRDTEIDEVGLLSLASRRLLAGGLGALECLANLLGTVLLCLRLLAQLFGIFGVLEPLAGERRQGLGSRVNVLLGLLACRLNSMHIQMSIHMSIHTLVQRAGTPVDRWINSSLK